MARAKKRAARARERRHGKFDFYELLPPFLRPSARAWKHFQAAGIEFCEGLRVALEESIEKMRRSSRRRPAGELTRIRVQG